MTRTAVRQVHERRGMRWLIGALALIAGASCALAAPPEQKTYPTAEAATAALADAVKSSDQVQLSAILGAHGSKLISSGDAVADERGRMAFARSYKEANKVVFQGDTKAQLVMGKDEWPFPIPLVKNDGGWRFDTEQGEQEVLNRRIGRNELATIQVCLAIVDAEREYAASHLDRDGVPQYTARIVSTPGKHDGLYWPAKHGEARAPLGPLVAAATDEGYAPGRSTVLAPYHGYFYRLLTTQGKNAPGGEYDYAIKGKLIGGFAAIAYPARYGASGIKTFIVNHDGVVFEKDLGENTATVASRMSAYDPDPTWKQVDVTPR